MTLNTFPEMTSFAAKIIGRTPPVGFNEEGFDPYKHHSHVSFGFVFLVWFFLHHAFKEILVTACSVYSCELG